MNTRTSSIVVLILTALLFAGCSNEPQPSTAQIQQSLAAQLPDFVRLSSFSVEAKQNVGTKVEPVWQTRFRATITFGSSTFTPDGVDAGVLFLRAAKNAGDSIEVFGKSISRLYAGNWNTSVEMEGQPLQATGLPESAFGTQKVIVRGSKAEADYLEKRRLYASTATMQFEKPEAGNDARLRSDIELSTNIQILESAPLRAKVVGSFTPEEVKILQRPYLKINPPGTPLPPPEATLGSVSISADRNNLIIGVTVRHPDPQAAALVANRYVSQFMNYLNEVVGSINKTAVEFLKTRGDQLRKESEDADAKLQVYMKQHNITSLDASKGIVGDMAVEFESLENQAEMAKSNYSQILDRLNRANFGKIPLHPLDAAVPSDAPETPNKVKP